MHIDLSTIGGRHLVIAYAAIFVIQGGYVAWVTMQLRKLAKEKKSARPV